METVVEELLDRQTAGERLFEALALALDAATVLPLEALLPMLKLMRANAQLVEGDGVARCMDFVIDRLQAHAETRSTGGRPLQSLLAEARLSAQTDPGLRAALQSFLAFATTDEIAHELDQALRPSSGAADAPDRHPGSAPEGLGPSGG